MIVYVRVFWILGRDITGKSIKDATVVVLIFSKRNRTRCTCINDDDDDNNLVLEPNG